MNLQDVFKYELGPLPLSIANYDDTLRKAQNSKPFKHINPDVPLCDASSERSPIFDGMLLLQKLSPNQTTMEHRDFLSLPQIITSTSLLSQWKEKNDQHMALQELKLCERSKSHRSNRKSS